MGVVRVIRYETLAPHDESEILRYAGVKVADEAIWGCLPICQAVKHRLNCPRE